jgi:deazaflavin-dependent oxidoreductase (nitroreductase family)
MRSRQFEIPPNESFCYVTTRGRVTGRPHEIEIWYVERDGALYLMAGGGERADWVKNMRAEPSVTVRLAGDQFDATAEVDPDDIDGLELRQRMAAKYQGWKDGSELSDWARTALLVRIRPT